MKKQLTAVAMILVLGLILTACGDGTSKGWSKLKKTHKAVSMPSFHTDAAIEESVLINEKNVKVTATDLNYTGYAVELHLLIENNSNKNLSFRAGTVGYSWNAVNGCMVDDGYLSADVQAGKRANESVSFSVDELLILGITEVADIQLGIQILDENDKCIYTGVSQINTAIADTHDYKKNTYAEMITSGALENEYDCSIDYFAEKELYNQKNVRIVSEVMMTKKDGEKGFLIELVNDTDEFVYGLVSDVSINGLMVYGGLWSSASLNPHSKRIMELKLTSMLDAEYWELFGLGEVGEMDFNFLLMDKDDNIRVSWQEVSVNIPKVKSKFDRDGKTVFEENGVRIVSKGLAEDPFEYSGDIHLLLLVENMTSTAINIEEVYGSFSVNGYMMDCIMSDARIVPDKCAVVDIQMFQMYLEENHIQSIEDIKDVELSLVVMTDNDKTIAKPKIHLVY